MCAVIYRPSGLPARSDGCRRTGNGGVSVAGLGCGGCGAQILWHDQEGQRVGDEANNNVARVLLRHGLRDPVGIFRRRHAAYPIEALPGHFHAEDGSRRVRFDPLDCTAAQTHVHLAVSDALIFGMK